jgi:hypothetical protein
MVFVLFTGVRAAGVSALDAVLRAWLARLGDGGAGPANDDDLPLQFVSGFCELNHVLLFGFCCLGSAFAAPGYSFSAAGLLFSWQYGRPAPAE